MNAHCALCTSSLYCWISFWYSSWILPRNPPHPSLPYCGWRSAGIVWAGQQGHEPNPPLESSIRSPSWSLRLLLLNFGAFGVHFIGFFPRKNPQVPPPLMWVKKRRQCLVGATNPIPPWISAQPPDNHLANQFAKQATITIRLIGIRNNQYVLLK